MNALDFQDVQLKAVEQSERLIARFEAEWYAPMVERMAMLEWLATPEEVKRMMPPEQRKQAEELFGGKNYG